MSADRARQRATAGSAPARVAALVATLALGSAALLAAPAAAASYSFGVPSLRLDAWVRGDGATEIAYVIRFENAPGAHPIDLVDVGLPHEDYRLDTMAAALDGEELDVPIRPSPRVAAGVEVALGPHAIPPGASATFAFRGVVKGMVWQDTTDDELASLQLKPTWFDPSLVRGRTDVSIHVHLPPGVEPGEVVWHSDELPFTGKAVAGTPPRVVASWSFPDRRLGPQNPKVGLSFPKRAVHRVRSMSAWALLGKWLDENPVVPGVAAVLVLLLTGFAWWRVTAGTGCLLFVLLAVGLVVLMVVVRPTILVLAPAAFLAAILAQRSARRRRGYVPTAAWVEGGGIKRGLSAPEAAVVLGLPPERILTLVVVGLLEKRLVAERSSTPLEVEVVRELRGSRAERLAAAARLGLVVHDWEHAFLDRLESGGPLRTKDLSKALEGLVRHAGLRVQGFDVAATREYYERIVARAWKEAERVHTKASFANHCRRDLEWLMLDRDWSERFASREQTGLAYVPHWRGDSTSSSGGGGATATGASAPAGGRTTAGEVAASFAGWTENASGDLLSAFAPSAVELSPGRPILDFADFDRSLGEMLAEMAKGGGGGGAGGSCACACAGCACACACAGGGV